MKKFKTESQRILDLMINSIYTHKEIFLRELISNASDALDKLYYQSITNNLGLSKDEFEIKIIPDKEARTLKIIDNGIGMNSTELEENLGIIAKSGSLDFKNQVESKEDINIIGQFGVGFYSSFMVSKKVTVLSKKYGEETAYLWSSNGHDGYDIKPSSKESYGTEITLYLKDDNEDTEEKYSDFITEYEIKNLIKKYSDYIRYKINLLVTHTAKEENSEKEITSQEYETINSLVPLWKKNKSDITEEEKNEFFKNVFYESDNPLSSIHLVIEGNVTYNALLFIPAKAPYNYYNKEYKRGLKLYSNGVLIDDKCEALLSESFSFVFGVVECELPLNISRETFQHNYQLTKIRESIEKKVKQELDRLLVEKREEYANFYSEFGTHIKYAIYNSFGMDSLNLKDLLLFHSLKEDKLITLKEYVDSMQEGQEFIYYIAGHSKDSASSLPQVEQIREKQYDLLVFDKEIDEFMIKTMYLGYMEKQFKSASDYDLGLKDVETEDSSFIDLATYATEVLKDKVAQVKFNPQLKNHPVSLSTKGNVSIEMEKALNELPNSKKVNAEKVLNISSTHPIASKLNDLFVNDKETLNKYLNILYSQARLIEGLKIEDPSALSRDISDILSK